MSEPVCTVGHKFAGSCSACDGNYTEGYMVDGEFATIEGQPICVTGSKGVGYCGHTTYAVGQSSVWNINGKPVARIGDPVVGTINGVLISGSDFVRSD